MNEETIKIQYDDNVIDIINKFELLLEKEDMELVNHTKEGEVYLEYSIQEK